MRKEGVRPGRDLPGDKLGCHPVAVASHLPEPPVVASTMWEET